MGQGDMYTMAVQLYVGLQDKRLVVAIDGWDSNNKYPRGHYVRTIGVMGNRDVETEVVLLEHDIPTRPFSADVLACLPPANWTISPADLAGRRDLRGLNVCSVDPPGSFVAPRSCVFVFFTSLFPFLPAMQAARILTMLFMRAGCRTGMSKSESTSRMCPILSRSQLPLMKRRRFGQTRHILSSGVSTCCPACSLKHFAALRVASSDSPSASLGNFVPLRSRVARPRGTRHQLSFLTVRGRQYQAL
jgi:hypothetical protein